MTSSDCRRRFEAAVSVIQGLPRNGSYRPSHGLMLKFYGYYKQATVGNCNISRPGFWDPIGRLKWDTWKALGSMSRQDAMTAYVEEIKKVAQEVIETSALTQRDKAVEEHFHLFEPLYAAVDDLPRPTGFTLNATSGDGERSLTSIPCVKMNGSLGSEQGDRASEPHLTTNGFHREEGEGDGSESSPSDGPSPGDEEAEGDAEISPREKEQKHHLVEVPSAPHSDGDNRTGEQISTPEPASNDLENEIYCDSLEEFDSKKMAPLDAGGGFPETPGEGDGDGARPRGRARATEPTLTRIPTALGGERAASGAGGCERTKSTLAGRPGTEGLRDNRAQRQSEDGGSRLQGLNMGREAGVGGGGRAPPPGLQDSVTSALSRMQRDIANMHERIARLEARLPAQRASKWSFARSGPTLIFLMLWPFVAQWIVHLIRRRRKRS